MWSQSLCFRRLWPRCLLLASPTNPVPLPVSATVRLSLSNSNMGFTFRLRRNTTHRLLSHITGGLPSHHSARSNTPTGRLQTNPTCRQDLTALHYTGRLPALVERSILKMSPVRSPLGSKVTQ